MGVVLTTGLVVGAFCAALEFKLYQSMPFLRWLTNKSLFFGLAVSLGISFVMGMMFSASGLTVLIAAVSSTLMTEPIHALIRRKEERAGDADATHVFQDVRDTYRPIWKFVKITMIVVSAPAWIPVKVHQYRNRNA